MTQAMTIPIQYDVAYLAQQTANAKQCLLVAQSLQVTNQGELEHANSWAQAILRMRDQLEDMRTSITKPILEGKRQVDNLFTPSTVPLLEASKIIKNTMGTYVMAERAKQEEAFRLAAAAHAAGDVQTMTQALVTSSDAKPDAPAGTSIKIVWVAEVVSLELLIAAAADNVFCRPFVQANTEALAYHAKATRENQEPAPIPGVRFVKRADATVRR